MSDWRVGRYEVTAEQLEPVARRLVSLAGVHPGMRVLDIACGTGNAALAVARAGGEVTGLDLAHRLLEVGAGRAVTENLKLSWVLGDAQALCFPGGEFDLVLSNFGVIFASDPDRAFGEVVRVLRPGGRALLSVWVPGSTVDQMVGVFVGAVRKVTNAGPPVGFEWHDPAAVARMAARHDVMAIFHEGLLEFTADSAGDYLESLLTHHPMFVRMRGALEAAGLFAGVRAQALELITSLNEDLAAFKVTSPYRVLDVRR